MRKRKRKIVIRVLLGLLLITTIGGYIGFTHIAPYAILQPGRVSSDITPSDYSVQSDPLTIRVADSIDLKAHWIYASEQDPKGVMIFVHGIGSCKESFIPLAASFALRGYSSVVFDLRAHGKSGGEFCTYGFYEKQDIAKIVDVIKEKHPNTPIGIWGNSLGGAISLQALEYDERIDFGIIESTFTELHIIVHDYKKRFLKGFGVKSLSNYALEKAGEVGSFDPMEVSPISSVKNIEQPVFIAHGDADERISYTYGKALYDNLASQNKHFELVEGAGHLNVGQIGGEAYMRLIFDFIEAQTKPISDEITF
ncbi:alpha/beta fold hydrolase [Aureisphaera galaxeae]|uniref:alpha/beta hydrolase n=1 Tax=Aureisphaera galaxeae TaxID=1538023 RepID=UPI00234FD722|nr:alpha/beta fold hydrolase [Aureisphaera galaxeae]MDC8004549.1 alpha/beta fold hydrolase [Aureisphaera galaxeae]